MKSIRFFLASVSIVAVGAVNTANAGTATSNLNVTATIDASCTIDSVSAVNFGNSYHPASTQPTYSAGSITVACVKGTHPTITLDAGQNPDGTTGLRAMKNATTSELLTYHLLKPAGVGHTCNNSETDAWGASGQSVFDPGVATGIAATTFSVCGKIDAQQDVSTGAYNDTVIATVVF